jgi:hypothetical protein
VILCALTSFTVVLTACGGSTGTGDDVASLTDTDTPTDNSAADSEDTVDDTADLTPEEAAIEFASCMRDEGVDMPDPEFDEDGGVMFQQGIASGDDGPSLSDRQAMDDAFEACGHIMENAGIGPGDGPDRAEMEDQVLEFTQCMRDEGVEMDDPDFDAPVGDLPAPSEASGAGPVIAGPFGTLDLGDPDVQAAFDQCQDIMGIPDAPSPADTEDSE